ncbi:MAG: MATE family efflux transporter, partial [Oscillospiraceae bacterium]
GRQYLSIASYSYILYGVTNVLYGVFKGTEKVKYVFWGNAVCYTLNIALNYVFIFGKFGVPALGVRGAALGTLIARCVEFIFVICMFSKKIDFKLRDIFRKNTLLLLDFLRVMRPIMGHELIWGIGTSMSQVVMGQISPMATTAYNITYMLYQLFASIFSGLGGAAQTIIGKTIGSGDTERVKKSARTLLIYATILGVFSMCSVLLLKTPFISLYNVSAETAQYAEKIMPIMAVALFFMAWEVVGLVNILRGGGDGKTGFFTDVVVMWMIAIPLGLLAAFRWNLSPVLIILFIKIDMPLKATVGLVRVLKMKWIKNLTRENTIL